MSEGLSTLDGKPVNLDEAERQFHASMAEPSPDEPAAAAPPRRDPDAPYGRKADGTPRKTAPGPGRPPRARTQSKTDAGKGKTPETPQDISERRTEGGEALVNVLAAICLGVSVRGGIAWKADAVTLNVSAKPLAQAATAVAEQDARFAAMLDKITASGPYAALAAAGIPVAAQLARNHGVTAMAALNAVPPEQLIAQLEQDQESPDAGSPATEG
jgi:hypothetical protein